ncbi:MAG: Gfo/Idh/MocA family oxidoreductase [Chloroflexi bacterium]|nr:Gfo/Idh/MocA family oxidoreductase [Chloroflexota bacterium]
MRIAMIEVGHWHAGMHLRSFQLAEGVEIVGVSDHQPGVAAAFAQESGGRAFERYQDMLEATAPDFVVAMGTHADMPAIARFVLEAGIPLAMEKPVGLSANDVAPLVELAEKRNAFVAVPLINRYSGMWRQLDELEAVGRVGARTHYHFRVINGPPERYELDGGGWMLDPAISGGGCLRNVGIHGIDGFLRFVQGEAVEVLSAALSYRAHGKAIEDFCAALLRSESGVIGTVEAGYSYASMKPGGDFEGRLAAANCYIIDRNDALHVATLDDGALRTPSIPDQGERYDQFGRDTLARLREGRPPIASLNDCCRAMQVIDEIYAKARRTPYRS